MTYISLVRAVQLHGYLDIRYNIYPCLSFIERTDYSMRINSLNWQHIRCKDPHPNPNMKTLFVDHVCQPQHNFSCAQSSENNSLVRSVLKVGIFFLKFPLSLPNWFLYSSWPKRLNYFCSLFYSFNNAQTLCFSLLKPHQIQFQLLLTIGILANLP